MAGKQAHIGRDALTRFQQDDIPEHQLLGVTFMRVTFTQDATTRGNQFLQGRGGTLCGKFLHRTDDGIE